MGFAPSHQVAKILHLIAASHILLASSLLGANQALTTLSAIPFHVSQMTMTSRCIGTITGGDKSIIRR
jgi:hypothetical protein